MCRRDTGMQKDLDTKERNTGRRESRLGMSFILTFSKGSSSHKAAFQQQNQPKVNILASEECAQCHDGSQTHPYIEYAEWYSFIVDMRFDSERQHESTFSRADAQAPAGATIPVASLVPFTELPSSFDYSGFLSSMNPPSGPMTDELNTEANSLTPAHPFHNPDITRSSTSLPAANSQEDPCGVAVRDSSEDSAIFSPAPLPSRRLSALRLTFILNWLTLAIPKTKFHSATYILT